MDLDGGSCRNMTESPYFLAIQEWNSVKVLTLLFLPFSWCAFCIVPLPPFVLRLHTAHNGLFSALPLLFTNFHCCESDLELKNGFTLTGVRRHSFVLRGRTEVRRLPDPYLQDEEPVAGPCLRKREGWGLASPSPGHRGRSASGSGIGEAASSGRWGRSGPRPA